MLLCRKSSCTSAVDDCHSSHITTTTSTCDVTPSTTQMSSTLTDVRNYARSTATDSQPTPATLPVNQHCGRTEALLTAVYRQNYINSYETSNNDLVKDDPPNADPAGSDPVKLHDAVSPVSQCVTPNTQRNSSEFTFAHSLQRAATASNRKIANDVCPTKAKALRSSATNVERSSNQDSLPEFSLDFDLTQSSLNVDSRSGDCPASSADFCPSVEASLNTESESVDKNETVVSRTICDTRPVNCISGGLSCVADSTCTLRSGGSSCSSLEPLLGKERMQRLMQNLRDINLVSAPRRDSHHHHLDRHNLSESADKSESSTTAASCCTKASSTAHETRTSDLREETRTSGVDEARTSADLCETKMSGLRERISSNLKTSSGPHERTCNAGDAEMEENNVKTRSLLTLVPYDLSSSSPPRHKSINTKPSRHVASTAVDTRTATDSVLTVARDGNGVPYSGNTEDVYRRAKRLGSSDHISGCLVLPLASTHGGNNHDEMPRSGDVELSQLDTKKTRMSGGVHSRPDKHSVEMKGTIQTQWPMDEHEVDDGDDDDVDLRQSRSSVQQHVDSSTNVLQRG